MDPEVCACCLCVRHQMQHTHTSIHTKKEQSGKQAGKRSQTRTPTHRGRSVRPVRTSALYQDDGQADGHQNSRLISAAKRIQETFSPHEWGTENTLSGKLSVKVSLIIKHSPWTAPIFFSSSPTSPAGIKKMKCAHCSVPLSKLTNAHIFKHR